MLDSWPILSYAQEVRGWLSSEPPDLFIAGLPISSHYVSLNFLPATWNEKVAEFVTSEAVGTLDEPLAHELLREALRLLSRNAPVPTGAHQLNPAIPIETFDLIVTDECHRSIYNQRRQVLEFFDASLIGLTRK